MTFGSCTTPCRKKSSSAALVSPSSDLPKSRARRSQRTPSTPTPSKPLTTAPTVCRCKQVGCKCNSLREDKLLPQSDAGVAQLSDPSPPVAGKCQAGFKNLRTGKALLAFLRTAANPDLNSGLKRTSAPVTTGADVGAAGTARSDFSSSGLWS